MPGLGSLSGAAAAAAAATVILLRFQSIVVLHAPFIAAESISERHEPVTPTGQAAFRRRPPAFHKVDIFLDLACQDSAIAWTTIKQMVREYGFRTKIVFHVLPMPQNQMALDTAKAVQAVQMFSADSEEVVLFMDAMFGYQPVILDDADDDVAKLGFRGILAKWAVAAGTITGDEFESAMGTPEIVDLVNHEKKFAASLEVRTTPTALLNGNFVVRLDGGEQLSNFRLFFAVAMASPPTTDDTDLAGVWELIDGRWIVGGEDQMDYSSSSGDSANPDEREEA